MQASTESMDDSGMLGLPPTLEPEPVSRPSSTSTNGTLSQIPKISSLAASNAQANSPPLSHLASAPPAPAPQQTTPQTAAIQPVAQLVQQAVHTGPAPTPTVVSGNQASTVPVCQNCETSTTPLWRRDEYGAVLCNACGLFLKLHGRARPISLKTDVIKSRNRVKTMRPDLATKKKQQAAQQAAAQQQQAQNTNFSGNDANGFDLNAPLGSVTPGTQRHNAQKSNGHGDANSPGSRGGTPSLYNPAMPGFHGLDDSHFQSAGLAGFSPNRPGSPLNGDRSLDAPQTHEQLIAANSALKTRVSELEVINELFRGRLGQLEHDEANARRGQEISGQAEAQLRSQLDESHRRENNLKRRLDEMELELKAAKDAAGLGDNDRPAKRTRLSEQPEDREAESAALAVERAGEDVSVIDHQSNESTAAAAVAAAAAVDAVANAANEASTSDKEEAHTDPQPTAEPVTEDVAIGSAVA